MIVWTTYYDLGPKYIINIYIYIYYHDSSCPLMILRSKSRFGHCGPRVHDKQVEDV